MMSNELIVFLCFFWDTGDNRGSLPPNPVQRISLEQLQGQASAVGYIAPVTFSSMPHNALLHREYRLPECTL